jgi:hypothetical protein
MIKVISKIKLALLHATFHRNMNCADKAREQQNIVKFKRYIYAAEDAWRKLVTLKEKHKL